MKISAEPGTFLHLAKEFGLLFERDFDAPGDAGEFRLLADDRGQRGRVLVGEAVADGVERVEHPAVKAEREGAHDQEAEHDKDPRLERVGFQALGDGGHLAGDVEHGRGSPAPIVERAEQGELGVGCGAGRRLVARAETDGAFGEIAERCEVVFVP